MFQVQETRTHCALLPDGVRDSAKKLEPSLEIEGSASGAKRSPKSIESKASTRKLQFYKKQKAIKKNKIKKEKNKKNKNKRTKNKKKTKKTNEEKNRLKRKKKRKTEKRSLIESNESRAFPRQRSLICFNLDVKLMEKELTS